jgi:hypothetical protein
MASALIVPGVQVKTQFEPAPVLPGATGILGLVGVTDRGPLEPTPVGSFGEFLNLFGTASRYTMPEAHTAFANGVMEIVVARTAPSGAKASLRLRDDDDEEVVILEARAEGAWGNHLAARVSQVRTIDQSGVKYVNIDVLLDGERVESLNNLVMDETNPNYLFAQINAQSHVVVAYDPLFEKALPPDTPKTPLASLSAEKASATLAGVAGDAVTVTAKQAGPAGNLIAVRVRPGGPPGSVTIDVIREGAETVTHADLDTPEKIKAISNSLVTFDATALPALTPGVPLVGGRSKGLALPLPASPEKALVTFIPASKAVSPAIEIEPGSGTGRATLLVYADAADADPAETFPDITMDPDDAAYLPAVLEESGLIRALDLFERRTASSLPREALKPQRFAGGVSPAISDYQDALDRLEAAEQVDMVIASVANQLDSANVRRVHQAVNAHCLKMADPARNRIGLGSVVPPPNSRRETRVAEILDHADDVRSDAFILCAPAGTEAAVAGLLSLQDYFQSPTFKTVPALGVAPGDFSDAELNQLVGGNVLVVNKKRKRGIIVVKGVLTSGRQINVQRTANKAVRDVKAIADVYVGLLNNEGNRNALRQQIIALFLQMTRDGALVPSTDGTDPPFRVDVYSTESDFANGIVRIDIAVRPVRAIDYVYATILVKN